MKRVLTIPENWNEVFYSTFYKYIKQTEGEEDAKVLTEMALFYLVGLEVKDYYSLSPEVFTYVNNTLVDLLNRQEGQPLVKKLNIKGVEYGFEPNIQEMSYGAYLDLCSYGKDLWKNMPIIVSILYRPIEQEIGDVYRIKEYTGTNDEDIRMFKNNLTMDVCLGLVGFFLNLQTSLLKHSLHSLLKGLKKETMDPEIIQQLEASQLSGDRINHLLPLLEEISSDLMKQKR